MRLNSLSKRCLWSAATGALILGSWGSYALPRGSWVDLAFPSYVVGLVLLGIGYQGFKRGGWAQIARRAEKRILQGLLISGYLASLMVMGVEVRDALPGQGEVAYSALFWGAAGAIFLITMAFNTRTTRPRADIQAGLRWVLAVLLFSIGIASGPIIWGWGPGPTRNTSVGMMAIVVYGIPLALYGMQAYPFSRSGLRSEVTKTA